MKKLILKAPAKVNLYLDVLKKRPDGYHDIETVFEKIALFDTVTIRSAADKKIRITTDCAGLPSGKNNLAHKAAEAVFKKAGFKGGVCIDIKKKIPVAAGLGGGSSDAASTLIGINRFFRLGLKRQELVGLGKAIGADVPFFLYDCSFAMGTGRGDLIQPLPAPNISIWHIIIPFNFGVSAASAYKGIDRNLRLTPRGRNVRILSRFIRPASPAEGGQGGSAMNRLKLGLGGKNDIENLAVSLYNRLEAFVLNRYGSVMAVKRLLLEEGARGALVSGSGPTVFGITKTRKEAVAVKKRIEKRIKGRADGILIASTL